MSSKTLHSASRMDSIKNNLNTSNILIERALVSTLTTAHNSLLNNTVPRQTINFSTFKALNLRETPRNIESAQNSTVSMNANDLNTQQEKVSKKTISFLPIQQQSQLVNGTLKMGEFLFFESKSQANPQDSFNSAYNLNEKKIFYWKVSLI